MIEGEDRSLFHLLLGASRGVNACVCTLEGVAQEQII